MDDIRCFIFDLDGTLIFNEHANLLAYQAAFTAVGLKLDEKDFRIHFQSGGSIEDIFADYTQNHVVENAPQQLKKIKELKSKEYAARFHLIEQNSTTVGLLRALAPHHFTALATTASEKNARALLEHFGLTHLFQYAVYGDSVMHKKPDPECHQKIADHFAVRPEECIIFEDSPKGVAAAEAFGAHICKVVQ